MAEGDGGEVGFEVGLAGEEAVAEGEGAVGAAGGGEAVVEGGNKGAHFDCLEVALLEGADVVELLEVEGGAVGVLERGERAEVREEVAIGGDKVGELAVGNDGVGAAGDVFESGVDVEVELLGGDEGVEVLDEDDALGVGGEGGKEVDEAENVAVGGNDVAVFLAEGGDNVVGAGGDGGAKVEGKEVALLDGDDGAQA